MNPKIDNQPRIPQTLVIGFYPVIVIKKMKAIYFMKKILNLTKINLKP